MPDLDTLDYHVADIRSFRGSWSSGLGHLVVEDMEGETFFIPCDNAPTIRALDSMFGNVIAPNHSVNQSAIEGKRILYHLDDLGVLEWLTLPDGEEVEA
jgi:hypothetical protein